MNLIHKTLGIGQVVSQDDSNITIDFNGTVKTFIIKYAGLTHEDGTTFGQAAIIPVVKKNKGQKRRERDAKELAAFNNQSNLDKIQQSILNINGKVYGDRNGLGYQIISDRLAGIYNVAKLQGNDFIVDVINNVEKYMRCSEKQAYVIAKFADDNKIKY